MREDIKSSASRFTVKRIRFNRLAIILLILIFVVTGGLIMSWIAKRNEDAKWFSSPQERRSDFRQNYVYNSWTMGGAVLPDRPPRPFSPIRIEEDSSEIRIFTTGNDPPMSCATDFASTDIFADENGVACLPCGAELRLRGVAFRPPGSDGKNLAYVDPISGESVGRRIGDRQHTNPEFPGVKFWIEASDDFSPAPHFFSASGFVDPTRTSLFARAKWEPDENAIVVDSGGAILYQTPLFLVVRFVHGEPTATEIPLEPGGQAIVGGVARYQFFDFNQFALKKDRTGPSLITFKKNGRSVSEPVLGRLNPNFCYSQVSLRLTGSKGSQTNYLHRDGGTHGFSSRRLGRLQKLEVLFWPHKTKVWFRIPRVPNSRLPPAEENLFDTVVDLQVESGHSPSIFADFFQFHYQFQSPVDRKVPFVVPMDFSQGFTVREMIKRYEKQNPGWKISCDPDRQLLSLRYEEENPAWYQKLWRDVRDFFGG